MRARPPGAPWPLPTARLSWSARCYPCACVCVAGCGWGRMGVGLFGIEGLVGGVDVGFENPASSNTGKDCRATQRNGNEAQERPEAPTCCTSHPGPAPAVATRSGAARQRSGWVWVGVGGGGAVGHVYVSFTSSFRGCSPELRTWCGIGIHAMRTGQHTQARWQTNDKQEKPLRWQALWFRVD